MSGTEPLTLKITHLTHDLANRQSIVSIVWPGAHKRLGLHVPYGTALEDVEQAAAKALRALSEELGAVNVRS